MGRRLIGVLFAVIVLAGTPFTAHAHKMRVFAAAEGGEISGTVYFGGGAVVAGAAVVATDESGAAVFEGTSDDEGRFKFAHGGGALVVTAQLPDGHKASFHVGGSMGGSMGGSVGGSDPATTGGADLEAMIARQINPLREELAAYQDEIRFRDVLGGIGIIFGLFGLFAYLRAHRGV